VPPATSLADGIWALRLPLPYPVVTSVNAYLLERAHGGHVLVDCGSSLEGGWEGLVGALEAAGVHPSGIGVLLCTHGHADHYGLAAEVVARTGCRLLMGPGPHPTIDVLRDPTVPWEERRALHRRAGTPPDELELLGGGVDNDDGRHPRIAPDVVLCTGDVVDARAGRWEVLPAPGHCADQVMLWDADRHWLIGADLAFPGVRPFVEYGTSADPHADYLASLDRALALEPELLLAGHGRPVSAVAETLTQARAAIAGGARRLLAALRDGPPRSAYELSLVLCPRDGERAARQRALSEALAALEHQEARGLVTSTLGEDGVRRWSAA
jgi:glyoxylase-like metal-dependent hydrolase (beta-lactamase superfamily II)